MAVIRKLGTCQTISIILQRTRVFLQSSKEAFFNISLKWVQVFLLCKEQTLLCCSWQSIWVLWTYSWVWWQQLPMTWTILESTSPSSSRPDTTWHPSTRYTPVCRWMSVCGWRALCLGLFETQFGFYLSCLEHICAGESPLEIYCGHAARVGTAVPPACWHVVRTHKHEYSIAGWFGYLKVLL